MSNCFFFTGPVLEDNPLFIINTNKFWKRKGGGEKTLGYHTEINKPYSGVQVNKSTDMQGRSQTPHQSYPGKGLEMGLWRFPPTKITVVHQV